jgi:hypothetical protein
VYLLNLTAAGVPRPVSLLNTTSSEASDFLWLSNGTIAYLNASSLYSLPINNGAVKPHELTATHLFDFPKGVEPSGLQYEPTSSLLAFSGRVWSDGDFDKTAYWEEKYAARRDSGQVYDELYVR